MSLKGKLSAEVTLKSSADEFHHQYRHKPHHISNFSDLIRAVELHEGEFGQHGSVISWHYNDLDGNEFWAKEVVHFDDATNKIVFEVIEGEIMKDYKSLVITLECEARGDGNADLVRWTVDYERLREDSPIPNEVITLLLLEGSHVEAEHVKKASVA